MRQSCFILRRKSFVVRLNSICQFFKPLVLFSPFLYPDVFLLSHNQNFLLSAVLVLIISFHLKKVIMKKLAITLVIIAVTAIIPSCSKLDYNISKPPKKPQVNNSMVMYWNDKANTVLSVPMIQPTRARHFAIISIAVHDALN